VAPLLAQIIYFASSRRREYLADAYSVVLTRNPEGLASALEEISASYIAKPIRDVNQLIAPMYIVNPLELRNLSSSSIFSTHPPIEKRIQILRSIAKNPTFSNYEQAWLKITKQKKTLIKESPKPEVSEQQTPTATIAFSPTQQSQTSSATTQSTTSYKLSPQDVKRNARSAGDALLKAQNYRFLRCYCGVLLKIPPQYKGKVTCPRCKSTHQIS
jgi:heat shock protein HtpX